MDAPEHNFPNYPEPRWPSRSYQPSLALSRLWTLLPYFLCFLLGVGLVASFPRSKPAAVKAPEPTFQIGTIADCQFMIFSNPFFVLHFPKCTNHPAPPPRYVWGVPGPNPQPTVPPGLPPSPYPQLE
jgi:hypothetical protein